MENHAHDHQPGQAVDGTHTEPWPVIRVPSSGSSRRDRNSESRTRDPHAQPGPRGSFVGGPHSLRSPLVRLGGLVTG